MNSWTLFIITAALFPEHFNLLHNQNMFLFDLYLCAPPYFLCWIKIASSYWHYEECLGHNVYKISESLKFTISGLKTSSLSLPPKTLFLPLFFFFCFLICTKGSFYANSSYFLADIFLFFSQLQSSFLNVWSHTLLFFTFFLSCFCSASLWLH